MSPELDAGAALRRLVENAPEEAPSSARKRRRTGLLVLAPALATIVFLVASAFLEAPSEPPSSSALETSAELTEAGPPVVSRPPVASPQSTPTRAPRKPAGRVAAPRVFAWAPTANASGYHVELYRGTSRVFAADTTDARMDFPATWLDDGRKQKLIPGEYRWYVWPIVNGTRATSATVRHAHGRRALRISPFAGKGPNP